jgi:hypothetical protein
MADIRCPNCGKSNPDLLDVCQFCQTPLKPDSVLRIGEKPTKKNTGELEPILPDWLKDVRQQARSAAEEEAQVEAQSQSSSNEPPDLLAGLASQAGDEDEDVPDWLASLNPTPREKPSAPSTAEPTQDLFAQLNQTESRSEPVRETPAEDTPAWMAGMRDQSPPPAEKDELSEWFTQASERPQETVESSGEHVDSGWGSPLDFSAEAAPPAKVEEDLSWLRNLEAESKKTGELDTPKQGADWNADFDLPSTPSATSASQNDLSWLDRLGGIEEPSQPQPDPSAASQSQGDLSWLDQFGGVSEPPAAAKPPASEQDLSWLNNLGAPSEPQPVDAAPNQQIPPEPFAPGEDLDWLNMLGGSQPAQSDQPLAEEKRPVEDLGWLNDLGGKPEELAAPPFAAPEPGVESITPRQTAPLNKDAVKDKDAVPDWLKRATEARSMPAPGDLSMEWFSSSNQPPQEKTPPSTPALAPVGSDLPSTPSESSSLSNEDVDSLFSVEMPDWLSRAEPEAQAGVPSQAGMCR